MKSSFVLCLVLAAIAPFFFLGGPSYHDMRSLKAGWDLGHVAFFSIASLLMYRFVIRKKPHWSCIVQYSVVFLCVFIVGVAIEILQYYTSEAGKRSPDVFDILRNQLGCLLALAFFVRKPYGRRMHVGIFQVLVLCGVLLALWPLVRSCTDELIAKTQFPVLADFETPFERLRWKNSRQLTSQHEVVRHGEGAARVQLSTAKYSGISLFYFPGDWRGYSAMHVSVYNSLKEALDLHCRIHDDKHKYSGMAFTDRYHNKFTLKNGWNDLVVPLEQVKNAPAGRVMEMGRIQNVGFFVIRQSEPKVIYIDHLYLSR